MRKMEGVIQSLWDQWIQVYRRQTLGTDLASTEVEHNRLWKILKEMGIPDHLTCLLRNLYAGREATVRTVAWNNRLVPNRKRSTSRLYIVSVVI